MLTVEVSELLLDGCEVELSDDSELLMLEVSDEFSELVDESVELVIDESVELSLESDELVIEVVDDSLGSELDELD